MPIIRKLARGEIDRLKRDWPEGSRVVLDAMGDDPDPPAAGTQGTVRIVDDMGTVFVDFDDGRRLGLIPGIDRWREA